MRSFVASLTTGLVLLLASSPAFAIEPPAPAPPAVDTPAAAPASPSVVAKEGMVLELGAGARVLAGQMFQGLAVSGVFAPVRGSIGYFMTPRFGILAGAEIGVGTLTQGCEVDCAQAAHFSFPISAQYAFVDHMRGPYLDAGLVLLPTYVATAEKTGADGSGETLKLSNVADANIGAGFRIPMSLGGSTRSALDIHLAANIGQFKSVEYSSGTESLAFDIDPAKTALHYSFALTAGWHFAP